MKRKHPAEREAITKERRIVEVVGYKQNCADCGKRFETAQPAETCSDTCKQRQKRERRRKA